MAKSHLKYVIGADISEAEKKFKALGNSIDRWGKKLGSVGRTASAALTAPILGIGALATKAALDYDDAMDDIRIGTGATGAVLKSLEADFKAIAAVVPQSFGETSKAVADFNTMTGASGKLLQELSVTALDASRMMKTDLGSVISTSTKAMNSWGISAGSGVAFMDKLFVASQSTGMGMDRIADSMSKFGPAFRALGFGAEESIALIAQLDKQGVQTDAVLGSLNKALATLAKAGIKDAGQAFDQILHSIRNAKNEQTAMEEASKVFGSKVTAHMVRAIREGKFEINDLSEALKGAGGAIRKTAEDTDGFVEQWARTKNAFSVALEPVGTKVLKMAEKEIGELSKYLKETSIDFDEGTIRILAYAAAFGPLSIGAGKILSGLGNMVKTFGSFNAGINKAIDGIQTLAATGNTFTALAAKLNATKAAALGLAASLAAVVAIGAGVALYQFMDHTEAGMETLDERQGMALNKSGRSKEIADKRKEILEQRKKEYEEQQRLLKEAAEATEKAIQAGNEVAASVPEVPGRGTETSGGFDYSKIGSGKSGSSVAERFAESARDRMKYLKADGQSFLSQIEAMQAKLKPLTDDWKVLEDLKIDIDQGSFDKALQKIQDRIRYLGEDGTKFLPDLEKMKAQFDPLSEKGKQVRDQLRGISEEMYGKKWSGYAWEFSEGLLKAGDYAKLLQAELVKVTQGTEEWKSRFSELQNLKATEAENMLNSLSRQFESGKLQNAEYESALAGIISQYEAFPRAAQIAADALEMFRQQNELTTASLGTQLSSALKDTTKDFNELGGKGVLGVVDGFLQASIHGDDFGASLKRLGEDIVYTTLKMIILQQLTKMLGGAFGMGGGGATSFMGSSAGGMGIPGLGGFTFADGGVFENGRVTPFARGGVVSSPTVFPMANGMGLMGEAGAEAVMPLTRDPQGRLGVRAAGGGGSPNVTVHVDNRTSTPIRAEQTGVGYDDLRNLVVNVMLEDQATMGPITRNYRR